MTAYAKHKTTKENVEVYSKAESYEKISDAAHSTHGYKLFDRDLQAWVFRIKGLSVTTPAGGVGISNFVVPDVFKEEVATAAEREKCSIYATLRPGGITDGFIQGADFTTDASNNVLIQIQFYSFVQYTSRTFDADILVIKESE